VNFNRVHVHEDIIMCAYILMKILESTPSRYDRGIRILTFGRLNKVYDRLVSRIDKGQRVIDLGCGTGELTLRAAKKGAKVKGIDVNPQMLEIAQKRVMEADLTQNVELCEMGVAELGSEKSDSYDAVMSSLCFSELTEDEVMYTLKEVKRILNPGGILLIADEVRAENILKKILQWLIRFPLIIITYSLTQTTTKSVKKLPQKVRESGLIIESIELTKMEDFIELVGSKPVRG
jgi:ubiquinone/menaquinone biosynthesis C-methylase UbiE